MDSHPLIPSALSRRPLAIPASMAIALATCMLPRVATAQECPGLSDLQHFTGGGTVACACFVPGEEAGVVFDLPADVFPIEIVKVGIGWGSQFGSGGQTIEQGINIYEGALPDPGTPVFTLPGPVLTDGAINEFDLDVLDVFVDSGPFTVTLEFLNQNSGDPFAPTVVHDGNGCQVGKNVIYAIPGGWLDVCTQGLTGDWIFTVTYRCEDVVDVVEVVSSPVTRVSYASPNPFASSSQIGFSLAASERARVVVYDIAGRALTTLVEGVFDAGNHVTTWSGMDAEGREVPPGVYFVELRTPTASHTAKVVRRD